VGKIATLKVDKDCHVDPPLEKDYVLQSVAILSKHHVKVKWIKTTRTRHGRHYYIQIDPAVDATTGNNLQYLLGDDAKRVSLNQARIDAGLAEWNLLFEAVGRRRRIIYRDLAVRHKRTSEIASAVDEETGGH
jgi:hypothetical protein